MSEVAEGAGISIGSLYQYFPDKSAVIRTLAERYNLYCLDCVRKELSLVRKDTELVTALGRVVDGYYEMFLAEPVMRDIAVAMQSDRALQAIDAADILAHAGLLETVIARLYPHCPPERRETIALLVNQLIATTVRLAISFEQARGETLIAAFKELTLRRLPDMLGQTG
jgi:AcrR family transcriptional regulator